MYQGGPADTSRNAEEYLLGKPVEERRGDNEVRKVENAAGSLLAKKSTTPATLNPLEEKNRLREDPLMGILKAEQKVRQEIVANPLKMLEMKKN